MKLTTLLLTFLLGATVAFAQGTAPAKADVFGKYEGTIKSPDGPVSLELKNDGKIWGRLQEGETAYESAEGTLEGGKLWLRIGKDVSITAQIDGDKITGELLQGTQKRAFEVQRIPAAAAATPATPAAAATDLSGQWEAVADANGQPFTFLLTLKIEGEKVSGNSSSQLGEAPIKEGSWKDGKLVFSVENQNGIISMSATVIEGKLSGEFDYAGQLQGKWVAVRKTN